jgi:hypothetical protein
MKRIVFLIMTIITLASCSKKVNSFLLNDYNTVEGIKIGMPINDALKVLDKKHHVEKSKVPAMDDDPITYEYLVYDKKTKKNLNNVFRIVIKNPKYKTPEGTSVGMNVKELKQKTQLKSADFNFQDGLYLLSGKFDGGYWIELDKTKNYDFNYEKPSLKKIPGDLKVKGIVLF